MYTHVMVGTNDLAKAKAFHDACFGALGHAPGTAAGDRVFYATETGAFAVGKPANGESATFANGGTIGFVATSPAQVDAWHAAALANGGTCEGAPGQRGQFGYGAYARDPDGNKFCVFAR